MMHLDTKGGQAIISDEEYFYILNRRGFYICSVNTEPMYVYVHCYSPPSYVNKVTWWAAGWTEKHIVIADVNKYYFMIPRHTREFETVGYNQYQHMHIKYAEDNKVPIVRSIMYSQKGLVSDRDEMEKNHFSHCLRFRQLSAKSRYKREDEWRNHKACIVESAGNGLKDRDKINIDGIVYRPIPGDLANDVCFSLDGLTLYVLHQLGKVSIIDVE